MATVVIARRESRKCAPLAKPQAKPASAHQNIDWFLENAEVLRDKYPDHWLAIRDRKVIDANPSVKDLRESLDADARAGYTVVRSKAGSTTVYR